MLKRAISALLIVGLVMLSAAAVGCNGDRDIKTEDHTEIEVQETVSQEMVPK